MSGASARLAPADFVYYANIVKCYGIKRWTLWNEPDNASECAGTFQQYYDMYKAVAPACKAIDSTIKFGGPELAQFQNMTSFVLPFIQSSRPMGCRSTSSPTTPRRPSGDPRQLQCPDSPSSSAASGDGSTPLGEIPVSGSPPARAAPTIRRRHRSRPRSTTATTTGPRRHRPGGHGHNGQLEEGHRADHRQPGRDPVRASLAERAGAAARRQPPREDRPLERVTMHSQ
jgi:hypothetical protein